MTDVSACVTEPARETPVVAQTDVLVVGGGPADLIIVSTFSFQTALLYATMAIGSLMALAFFGIVVLLEHLVVRWKPDTPVT